MKYTTIDGQQFDCELEALRYENDILIDRLNGKKCAMNKAYGQAEQPLDYITPTLPQDLIDKLTEQMKKTFDTDNVVYDADSCMFWVDGTQDFIDDEEDDLFDGVCCYKKPAERHIKLNPVDFTEIPTGVLVDELAKRIDVTDIKTEPGDTIHMVLEGHDGNPDNVEYDGPVRILVMRD